MPIDFQNQICMKNEKAVANLTNNQTSFKRFLTNQTLFLQQTNISGKRKLIFTSDIEGLRSNFRNFY